MASTSEKLRRRRAELGKTQEWVASKAKMSTVQYNGYENDRHEPSEPTMARLARALDTTAESLWDDSYAEVDGSIEKLIADLKSKIASEMGRSVRAAQIKIMIEVGA